MGQSAWRARKRAATEVNSAGVWLSDMDSNLFPTSFHREHKSRLLQRSCLSLQRPMREIAFAVNGFVAAGGNA